MQTKSEGFLNFLFWTASLLSRPTFRNLTDSYEGWLYRDGLNQRIYRLQKQGLIESDYNARNDRLYRLSTRGRLHVLGGRDPEERWSRRWDGRWRMVLFDIPVARNADRAELRRYLHSRGFGCLQKSVWITPDSLDTERQIVGRGRINVKSLFLLEGLPNGGESNDQFVCGAWDFEGINSRYQQYLEVLTRYPALDLNSESARRKLSRWAAKERAAWLCAIGYDPLLPEQLLPVGYQGQESWRQRQEILARIGEHIRCFHIRN